MPIETNGTNTLECYSPLWLRWCTFRQYAFLRDGACLSLPACLHLYMFLTQGGEVGKRGTNCTLTFTHHWSTFFGTRVQNCDLSCQGMIHVFVFCCQKERVIIICLCVRVWDVMVSESSRPHFPKLETWARWNRLLLPIGLGDITCVKWNIFSTEWYYRVTSDQD